MNNTLHGSGAFRHSPQCGSCVNDKEYKVPPFQHGNVAQPPDTRMYRIKIKLRVAPPIGHSSHRYFPNIAKVRKFLVDSGCTTSIFKAQIARDLEISDSVTKGSPADAILPSGAKQPCRQFEVSVFLGGKYENIRVLWPVKLGQKGKTELADGFPAIGNVLGMTDILGKNILCLTPEMVYILPLKDK